MSEPGSNFPKKYKHTEVEAKWRENWEKQGLYRWDPSLSRENTYIVDTPPPTVSGSLHVGSAYSYSQTDIVVRYKRMRGKNIFYPMGWDDNGLPTERRVQSVFNIRCDAKLPFDQNWKPDLMKKQKEIKLVSRRNFIEACSLLTEEDEKVFEHVWRKLGLSVDWSLIYTTIGRHCQRISQFSFLDLVKKQKAFHAQSITMWDTDFKTAVAQAEVEDREISGAYYDLRFSTPDGGDFIISTTRPELLAACIAVAAHPDDDRYKHLFGKKAITPLFRVPVPIVASSHADPEKGSGILMICTFGDVADVDWWKLSNLPIRQIIGRNGRLLDIKFGEGVFESLDPEAAERAYKEISGLRVKQARGEIVKLLAREGSHASGSGIAMAGDPKEVKHPVRFYEKGDSPLEFVPTRQWFVRILDSRVGLINQGRKIVWHPDYMRGRFEHWVEGLNQEWCISRQRFLGVPFPVWYQLGEDGSPDYEKPIFADEKRLPVDPLTETPEGWKESQRDIPGGFTGDCDVMDTWATSSLTPQISSHWGINEERHRKLFPADLRPQSHDIIRTWTFYTIVKAFLHEKVVPWRHIVISGFILDPDRKKMSKSKGNAVTPEDLLNERSSDVFRYWAARGRPGVDSTFDDTGFKMGRKLVTKVFNASRFVLMQLESAKEENVAYSVEDIREDFDRAFLESMRKVIDSSTAAFEKYDYTGALQLAEDAFWNFCDYYLEMVKIVAYQGGHTARRKSALASLDWTLRIFLRLFAPFLPFITEEIWSWRFSESGSSIHRAPWPSTEEVKNVKGPSKEKIFEAAMQALSLARSAKTGEKVSLKIPFVKWEYRGTEQALGQLEPALPYVMDASATGVWPELTRIPSDPEGGMFIFSGTPGESEEKE